MTPAVRSPPGNKRTTCSPTDGDHQVRASPARCVTQRNQVVGALNKTYKRREHKAVLPLQAEDGLQREQLPG
ncbi:hypothetical protein CFter6_2224 [Collimonas fungivorans]|uniref:Uncharacterized protein n=1 Tax=Collimonas fungivorans TaxID=158899 RepID=A0A127PAS3_9BURK|nr:hypothetical protein CFter6_2224 [Collimonas fungivorans]